MMLNSKHIGNKIVEARKSLNLSQAELAQQVSISPQAVGKWERGESMPDITMLNKLASIFNVDLNYFIGNTHLNAMPDSNSENTGNQDAKTFIANPKKRYPWSWDMSKSNWVDADFSGLRNVQEKFSGSNIKNCKFLNSELSNLILQGNCVVACDFSNSDLRNSKIKESELSKNDFTNCSLIDAIIESCELKDCDFSNVNFSGAEFITSELKNITTKNAIWNLTSFKISHFSNITFNGIIEDCIFERCTFSKIVFSGATLKNTFFKCRTLKNIIFEDCQADRMTYEFLKNGKANLTGLALLN